MELRYVDNPTDCGLRFVSYADEIVNLRHTGWYCQGGEFSDETYRGAVWQLPARRGVERFIAGYVEPWNDGAVVEFDITDDKETAARWADGIAEREAEKARDHDTAWQAGRYWAELADEIADTRHRILSVIREFKRERGNMDMPAYRQRVREYVRDGLDLICDWRTDQKTLIDGDHPRFYWYSGDPALCDAFNDGAGEQVA